MSKFTVRLIISLVIFWLLLSGYFKANLLILGVLSVALVCLFSIKMNVGEHKGQPLYFPLIKILKYWKWLFVEIINSNMDVAKIIINPKLPIKPRLKIIPTAHDTEIGRVIYANSITLTPGTVALNVSVDRGIIVHALHRQSIRELEKGEMHDRVLRLEQNILAETQDSLKNSDTKDSVSTEHNSEKDS